jgi:hypothetical protein
MLKTVIIYTLMFGSFLLPVVANANTQPGKNNKELFVSQIYTQDTPGWQNTRWGMTIEDEPIPLIKLFESIYG